MMDERLTRCPHCKTCFVITEAILQRAFGVARCGNCLKIYNASHHMFELEKGIRTDDLVTQTLAPVPEQPTEKPRANPTASVSAHETPDASPLPNIGSFDFDDAELKNIRSAHLSSDTTAKPRKIDQSLQTLIADPEFHQGNVGDSRRFPKVSDRSPIVERLKQTLLLPLALTMTAVSVIFILLWANSRFLAQYPALEGLTQSICSFATCDHLLISDFKQLEAKQMSLVASEGEHLYAEFVLENSGAQITFPAISITLQNAKGEKLSERTFQPDQYLQNKPFADHQLPSGLPISLSFPFPPTEQEVKHFAILFLPPLN